MKWLLCPLLLPLLSCLLLIGCGEKSSSEGSESATGRIPDPSEISLTVESQLKVLGFHQAGALGYKIKGDAVTITGWDEKASVALTIPATIEGKSVTSIAYNAFIYCTRLTSITIPDGDISIEENAFYECTSLTGITIGEGATTIEDGAFYGCASLTAVTFLGDAPKAASDEHFYKATPTIYRKPEAKGWRDTWGGRPVKLISEKP